MKVSIENLAWIDKVELTKQEYNTCLQDLTFLPYLIEEAGRVEDPEPLFAYTVKYDRLGIPVEYYLDNKTKLRNPIGYDKTSEGKKVEYKSIIKKDDTYKEQDEAVDRLLEWYKVHHGAIINAPVGWGKTIFALKLIVKLGVNVVIVIHRDILIRQWKKKIEEFLPGTKIGYAQGMRWKSGSIMLASLKSLVSNDYGLDFWKAGLVIYDEVHHMSAQTFSLVSSKFYSRYRLGLTATPKRFDRTENLFFCTIGPIVFNAKTETLIPKIKFVENQWKHTSNNVENRTISSVMKHKILIDEMIADNDRNLLIISETTRACLSDKKRKVLVLSERVQHLEQLSYYFNGFCSTTGIKISSIVYVGSSNNFVDLNIIDKQVIFATKQLCSEGMDLPALDTLIMATPIINPEQAIGRIRRICNNKKYDCNAFCPWRKGECIEKPVPIVVDIIDVGENRLMEDYVERRKFYKKFLEVKDNGNEKVV